MKNLSLRFAIRSIAMSLLCMYTANIFAQVQTPRYEPIPKTNSNGYYEYLPKGYDANGSQTYPLIIFVHGIGENGDGSASQLGKVLNNGTPRQISQGIFPESFTVNGQNFKFIVISPQFTYWPGPNDIYNIIDFAVSKYKVDVSRIYLTGLSMGGGVVWEYAGNSVAYGNRLAAIVPICGASYPDVTRSNNIAAANIAVWATTNDNDPSVGSSQTIGYVTNINKAPVKPNPLAKLTVFSANYHDAWSKTYDLNFRENGLNVYEWMLQYKRGGVVTPPANQVPTANAGADKTITLPTNSVTLAGSGTDSDGSISSYAWTKVSGSTATIVSPTSGTTTISNLVQGTYTFRLTVTDNGGLTKTDDVIVTVNAAPTTTNQAPTANAGADKSITLPTNSLTLSGSGTDPDGTISSYAWTKVSGSTATIVSPTSASTVINSLVQGTYTFRLTVTDNGGLTKTDDVIITVKAASAANVAPTANAGADKTITLPTNSVTLSGSGTDTDGTVSGYYWTKAAGLPVTIAAQGSATTTITGLVEGTYTFRLTVTDNKGLNNTDDVVVTVKAASTVVANVAPIANAGADKTITLPINSVSLIGSGTDADGTISNYAWAKISGPSSGIIASVASGTTTITSLVQGVYTYQLTVTDNNGATGKDTVKVTVNAAIALLAPVANAGSDKTITLPVNNVTVNGTGSDADGSISSYAWTKVAGPSTFTIASPSAATTAINNLVAGAYTFRLTVTDNAGLTDADDVLINVVAAQSAIPTTSGKIIHVNLYDANTPYSNTQWNNWNIGTGLLNLNSNTFLYENGTASTVKATLSSQARTGDNGANYAAAATVCPAPVLKYASLHCIDRTITIQGLKPGTQYSFKFYASRAFAGQGSIYKIGNVADTITTDYNANDYAKFTNVSPDSKGNVVVSLRSAALWNYISGFTITELSTSGARALLSDIENNSLVTMSPDLFAKMKVSVYPNPVQSVLQISTDIAAVNQPASITLLNAEGKIMYQQQTRFAQKNTNMQIDISSFKDGVYILNVKVAGKSLSKQIVKASSK